MNLIEHLEHILRLVERPASQAEIKGALLAMQEEVAGAQQAAAKNVTLIQENAALRAENAKLKTEPPEPPKLKFNIGKFPRQPI